MGCSCRKFTYLKLALRVDVRGRHAPRCEAQMDEILRIAPLAKEPGLVAYECPKCGYVTRS
jgi:hypothetical protein